MPFDDIDRPAVLSVIEQYDHLGRDAFLARYKFGRSRTTFLYYNGRTYDAKAIVGAAHGFLGKGRKSLPAENFHGGVPVKRLLERLGFEIHVQPRYIGDIAYWWVNNGQTFRQEIGGNYLWSPLTRRNGGRNVFYENMLRVRPGDVVFAYADGHMRAVGECITPAVLAAKPYEFGATGSIWSDEGWLVRVNFTRISVPLRPADHMDIIGPQLPSKYSPIREDGHGNQGAYLASVSESMAQTLIRLLGPAWEEFKWQEPAGGTEEADAAVEAALRNRADLPETEKQQLIMARRGQGTFRANVSRFEDCCRVTGAFHPQHLRASHMKPWRISTNSERLDGNNGLLLSPHIDHLFDQGYITFEDNGALLISAYADPDTLARWGIEADGEGSPFRAEQLLFLRHHRECVFKDDH